MRPPLTFLVALAVATDMAGPAGAAPAAAASETIEVAQANGMLKAVLFRPEGAGPFPAVVGLHGCAGLFDRGGAIARRYRDWAQHLVKAGFVVL